MDFKEHLKPIKKNRDNYAYITDKFRLPFRIDMTVKTNSRRFQFNTGKGSIAFIGT
jgi:hypothetical protein